MRTFPQGEEASSLWAWLENQHALDRLTDALRRVDREDLARELEAAVPADTVRPSPDPRDPPRPPFRRRRLPLLLVIGLLVAAGVGVGVWWVQPAGCLHEVTLTGIRTSALGGDDIAWPSCAQTAGKQRVLVRESPSVGDPGTAKHPEYYLLSELDQDATSGVASFPAVRCGDEYRYFVISVDAAERTRLEASIGTDPRVGGRIGNIGYWGGSFPATIASLVVSDPTPGPPALLGVQASVIGALRVCRPTGAARWFQGIIGVARVARPGR